MRTAEFVPLMALTMATVALSTDAVLPALPMMGTDLGADDNRRQLVIGALFLGMASSQMLFGPISDTLGRKPVILFGFALFCLGCLISLWAPDFDIMLLGRFVSGVGAAAPRVISTAIIRDRFEGRQMAKTVSMIMTIFILVPVFAPAIGQGILAFTDWRGIFWLFLIIAVLTTLWMGFRLEETLHPEHRHPLTVRRVGGAFAEIVSHRVTMGYLLAMSCVASAFVGYLSSAQQVFQDVYGMGDRFPIAFGGLACSIGLASFANSRLVVRFGMRLLVRWSLAAMSILATAFLVSAVAMGGVPPLWVVFALLVPMFFCHGAVFGNMNAVAMQPMGHIAGSAAAVIGAVSTVLSAVAGSLVGQAYDGTVIPLAGAFALLSIMALAITTWANRAFSDVS